MIYHLSYRVSRGPRQHIYAIRSICEKKKKLLIQEHGENVKFSRIVVANYP